MTFQPIRACPECSREYRLNANGTLRRHWCGPVVGDSRTVKLATGGALTVRLSAKWVDFGKRERELLCVIVDAMHDYEEATSVNAGATPLADGAPESAQSLSSSLRPPAAPEGE